MRLGRGGSFFLIWKLHSISLGKSTVYLHKCPALGLRNYHIDVSSREETECSKDEKTVGPNGHLEQMEGDTLDNTLSVFVSHRDFLHGQIYSTPKNSRKTGASLTSKRNA